MVTAAFSSWLTRLPRTGGVLPPVHQGLRCHCCPLTKLLKKEGFAWTPEAMAAFDGLKLALSTAPVLQLLDFGWPFTMDYDSDSGFGAVLHQGDGALAFFSLPFVAQYLKLVAYEHELIRLV